METTADLSLLMPDPEISENTLMRERAGEITDTEVDVSARSSAKANDLISWSFFVRNYEEEGRQGAPLFHTSHYVYPVK